MKRKLNFSCGIDIRKGWDNCDNQQTNGVIYCDANKFPYPFEDNTYQLIEMRQCLNVFADPLKCLDEIHRISKKNAIIVIELPYASNMGVYSDMSTTQFYTEKTFYNFVDPVNYIYKEKKYEIVDIHLKPTWVFKYVPKFIINTPKFSSEL